MSAVCQAGGLVGEACHCQMQEPKVSVLFHGGEKSKPQMLAFDTCLQPL